MRHLEGFLRRAVLYLAALAAAFLLSGCMALALAPVANAMTDKPVSWEYTTTARKAAVFNAALKALNTKGSTESSDRETGTIRGSVTVSMGQAAYEVVISVEEERGKTKLRVSAKLAGVYKFDLKNSSDLANELVEDIERQLGTKLVRT